MINSFYDVSYDISFSFTYLYTFVISQENINEAYVFSRRLKISRFAYFCIYWKGNFNDISFLIVRQASMKNDIRIPTIVSHKLL